MTEQNPEDVTFQEMVDYLRNQNVPQLVRLEVAGYVGTMNVQAWHRGLVQGLEK